MIGVTIPSVYVHLLKLCRYSLSTVQIRAVVLGIVLSIVTGLWPLIPEILPLTNERGKGLSHDSYLARAETSMGKIKRPLIVVQTR